MTPRGPVASVATPRLALADIVRAHGDVYRRTPRLAQVQAVALRAIERCRTAALGGHRATCDRCGAARITYNSCRNRHCPKCQTVAKERWLAARKADLLPIPYFHVVFTLPHALNALAQGNPRVMYPLLFRATAGRSSFLWVVYAKRPFAGPEQVLDYLGRYTHRVALSNDRLVDHRDGRVQFHWRDYADHDRRKVMTLAVDEFLRRLLLHIVPRGFMRIRHFGLLANRTRRGTVTRCRDLLGHPLIEAALPESVTVLLQRLTGVDRSRCAVCGEGRMQIAAIVVRVPPPPDTS